MALLPPAPTEAQTAPTFVSAEVNGATMAVTFSGPLDGAAKPPNSAFTVSATIEGGLTVSSYILWETTAFMALNRAVTEEQAVYIAYTKPGSGPALRDRAGNDLDTFDPQWVTNVTDSTPPTVSAYAPEDGAVGIAENANLVLTFSEPVSIRRGAGMGISVGPPLDPPSPGGVRQGIDTGDGLQVSVSGDGLTVTIDPPNDLSSGENQSVRINGNVLVDAAGNYYAGINDDTTWNFTPDTIRPAFVSATVTGATLEVTFSKTLREDAKGANSDFTVTVEGSHRAVSGYTLSGATAALLLDGAVSSGQAVTVAYTSPANGTPLQDWASNTVDTFAAQAVTNATPPAFVSAEVNGATLVVTFSGPLHSAAKPPNSAFTVSATIEGGLTVSGYILSGTTAIMALNRAVTGEQVVYIAYTKPGSGPALRDLAGNDLDTFDPQRVTNVTP